MSLKNVPILLGSVPAEGAEQQLNSCANCHN